MGDVVTAESAIDFEAPSSSPNGEPFTLLFSSPGAEGSLLDSEDQPPEDGGGSSPLFAADPAYLLLPGEEEYPAVEPTRVDRTDDAGEVIGYSLITEYPWGTRTQDDYDLDDALIASTYSDGSGYTSVSTWETMVDDSGQVTGRRFTFKSVSESSSYSSTELYATDGSLISSSSSSSDGDWSETERLDPPEGVEIGPHPLGYSLHTSGGWADGTTYERTELYTNDGILVSSESHNSDGSSDRYALTPQYNDAGVLIGYQGNWTWIDANGEATQSYWTQDFDTDLNDITVYHRGGVLYTMNALGANLKTFDTEGGAGDSITSVFRDIRLNAAKHAGLTHADLRGDADLSLRGNDLANVLDGNAGDNRIYGGLSRDLLSGGRGKDDFIFKAVRHSRDTITDFNPSKDQLALKGKAFGCLFNQGRLRSDVIGQALIFDDASHELRFVPGGDCGNEQPMTLAVLPDLHASDLRRALFIQATVPVLTVDP